MPRLWFPTLLSFWVVMMLLLMRAEYGGTLRGTLPVDSVVQRILTSPDDSKLVIFHRGERMGTLRWVPNVGQAVETGKITTEIPPGVDPATLTPEGQVSSILSYTLDMDGSLYITHGEPPIRYDARLVLTTNQLWKEFTIRAVKRPYRWELRASQQEQTLSIGQKDEQDPWEKTFRFEDLSHPDRVLAQLGLPWASMMLGPLIETHLPGTGTGVNSLTNLSLGLQWEATLGSMPVSKSSVRVYRLSAKLFDRYEAVVYVSRLGELLRVELPDGLLLVNERWLNL
jgi:hypothetical protein